MEDTILSTVDGGAVRDEHDRMGDEDEFEDEPLVDDEELVAFEKTLFTAIRESQRLDVEIDDDLDRLVEGTYDAPSVPEPGSDGGGAA